MKNKAIITDEDSKDYAITGIVISKFNWLFTTYYKIKLCTGEIKRFKAENVEIYE